MPEGCGEKTLPLLALPLQFRYQSDVFGCSAVAPVLWHLSCHWANTSSPSILKHLLAGEGGCSTRGAGPDEDAVQHERPNLRREQSVILLDHRLPLAGVFDMEGEWVLAQ